MGLFGNRPGYNPPWMTPGYGDGTPQGSLGMPTPQLDDFTPAPDQFADQRPQGGGIFGKLKNVDWGSVLLGGIADGVATWGGAKPGYASAMAEDRDWQRELVKAKLLAQLKDRDPDEPSTVRALRAAGIDPTSPEGRRIITDNLTRPFMMGSPETGFNMVGGSYGAPQPQLQPGHVEDGYVFMGGDPSNPASWRQQ